jgi:hypothetical protein
MCVKRAHGAGRPVAHVQHHFEPTRKVQLFSDVLSIPLDGLLRPPSRNVAFARQETAIAVELHDIRIVVEQAIAVASTKSNSIVLRRVVGCRDIGGTPEPIHSGYIAYNGDRDDAIAVYLAACAENALQKCLLQGWSANTGVPSQETLSSI